MSVVRVYWLGGPVDGSFMLLEEQYLATPIKVLTGSPKHPQERHVTPRLTGEKWVLPFYEGKIAKETR